MITAKAKFYTLLSSVQIVSDNLMLEIIDGRYDAKQPLSKEENECIIKRLLAQNEDRTRAHENSNFWESVIPLIPLDDLNLVPQNFDVFNLYSDVITEVANELERQTTLREKKQYLESLLIEVEKYKDLYLSNDHGKVEHEHEGIPGKLSKRFKHQNTWALIEIYRRYYEAFYHHITSLHSLIHLSLKNLSNITIGTESRFIWVYKEGVNGYAFELFYEKLKELKLIDSTTTLKMFKAIFSDKIHISIEKVTWIGTAHQLHYFIDELKNRNVIQPIGDIWMATVKLFKQSSGMDFNYKSLKGSTDAPSKVRKEVIEVLDAIGIMKVPKKL